MMWSEKIHRHLMFPNLCSSHFIIFIQGPGTIGIHQPLGEAVVAFGPTLPRASNASLGVDALQCQYLQL